MYLELTYNLETVVSAATFDCIIFINIDPLIIVRSSTLLLYKFICSTVMTLNMVFFLKLTRKCQHIYLLIYI
jgi:hypothetical protein